MGVSINTTVVTPAGSADLVDLTTVKDDWGISGTSDDAFLSRSITRCSAAAAQFTNRVFVVETVKDDIRIDRDAYPWQVPGGVAPLQLSRWPVVGVSEVVEGVGDSAQTLTADIDFSVSKATGQLIRLNSDGNPMKWPATRVEVTYSAGYSPIPMDVQDAVSRMVWVRYAERRRDPFVKSIAVEGVDRVDYIIPSGDSGNLPPDVEDLLNNYRVPVTA